MMIFHNPGIIDLDAALTMGVSVKEGDSPIGYFGTGLKFAIATILRNNGSITLWRGTDKHEFGVDEKMIRGEKFQLVTMDGERLGFTTQLGRNWLPWMAFRELASNCQDEGGKFFLSKSAGDVCEAHAAGNTTFMVDGLDLIWPDRGTILLETNPITANEHFEVHPGINQFVFYRGVRIFQAPAPLAFTYNVIEPMELTEDRQAKSWHHLELSLERGIGKLDDEQILRRILTCGDMFAEHSMNVPTYGQPQDAFRAVARAVSMGAESTNANPAAVSFARASAIEDLKPGEGLDLNPVQTLMLQRAKWMLLKNGIDSEAFPIICLDTLGPSIHGMAKAGKIYLAEKAFEKGTRELAATLFEEWAHLKSGQTDATLAFQNFLIDRVLIQIESMEGEPF